MNRSNCDAAVEAIRRTRDLLRLDSEALVQSLREEVLSQIRAQIPRNQPLRDFNERFPLLSSLSNDPEDDHMQAFFQQPYTTRVKMALEHADEILQKMGLGEILIYLEDCRRVGVERSNYRAGVRAKRLKAEELTRRFPKALNSRYIVAGDDQISVKQKQPPSEPLTSPDKGLVKQTQVNGALPVKPDRGGEKTKVKVFPIDPQASRTYLESMLEAHPVEEAVEKKKKNS